MKDTIIKIYEKNNQKIGMMKSAAKYLDELMEIDENPIYATTCNIENNSNDDKLNINNLSMKNKTSGIVVVTNKRIMFCQKVLMQVIFKQINISDITSIDSKTTPLAGYGKLRIKGITEMLIIDCNNHTVMQNITNAINKAKSISSNQTSNNTSFDNYEELKKVKELLDMGIITQEEFEIKKKELLGI
ncbi:SHOCT domain-containing protein [Candidatus Stoquefichus sp. SB1]|uniref:SHOCT domain-containing protein n=1 Tax=Candidatus Stoquefichus sp. SB1 TaxID=1658109 RepID=UPI00067E791F|nr:SHOCT domain-containing protein [Candidatus Stoquefichus sp. SB1]